LVEIEKEVLNFKGNKEYNFFKKKEESALFK
jgi:hypothetical protein